jgi:phosphatidylserine/phosphatidylglycerophosphate/cardiolipin synthase-like enzyme
MRRAAALLAMALPQALALTSALTPALAVPADRPARGEAATVETCFTPRRRCTGVIVAAIDRARRDIYVQAYGFTSAPIVGALVSAYRRGVRVAAILDKSNTRRSGRFDGAGIIDAAGIPVWIDRRKGIAHNKVIVIDGRFVVTGSFNFTAAADRWNAENVVVLESAVVAAQYLANWRSLLAAARRYDGPEPPPRSLRFPRSGSARR